MYDVSGCLRRYEPDIDVSRSTGEQVAQLRAAFRRAPGAVSSLLVWCVRAAIADEAGKRLGGRVQSTFGVLLDGRARAIDKGTTILEKSVGEGALVAVLRLGIVLDWRRVRLIVGGRVCDGLGRSR